MLKEWKGHPKGDPLVQKTEKDNAEQCTQIAAKFFLCLHGSDYYLSTVIEIPC